MKNSLSLSQALFGSTVKCLQVRAFEYLSQDPPDLPSLLSYLREQKELCDTDCATIVSAVIKCFPDKLCEWLNLLVPLVDAKQDIPIAAPYPFGWGLATGLFQGLSHPSSRLSKNPSAVSVFTQLGTQLLTSGSQATNHSSTLLYGTAWEHQVINQKVVQAYRKDMEDRLSNAISEFCQANKTIVTDLLIHVSRQFAPVRRLPKGVSLGKALASLGKPGTMKSPPSHLQQHICNQFARFVFNNMDAREQVGAVSTYLARCQPKQP